MHGAENITDVARTVRPPLAHHNSLSSSDAHQADRSAVDPSGEGALAAADRALSQFLGNSGFVDIAASFTESFAACLDFHPVKVEVEELDPGALRELMAFTTSKITADPRQSVQIQAHVRSQAAVKLLM